MRISRKATALGAAVVMLAASGAATMAASAASAATMTGYHYNDPYVLWMVNRNVEAMRVRPGHMKVMPGLSLSGLRWRSWNAHAAKGTGVVSDSAGRGTVGLWLGHPVWTYAPMGPTKFRTFDWMTIHGSNGYFRYRWHQDYAEGGHWSLAVHYG